MTTLARQLMSCSVCGKETEFRQILGTNAFGSPDLDLRPPEMQRSTIPLWVQECPNCGYVNQTIGNKLPDGADESLLRSERYKNCDDIPFLSETAKRFYRYYLICKAANDDEQARFAITCTAWMCDDSHDRENAKRCRKIAAELIREQFVMEPSLELAVLWADHMRRAEEFERVVEETEGIIPQEETLYVLLAFERKHAKIQDARCYTVEYALEEMG